MIRFARSFISFPSSVPDSPYPHDLYADVEGPLTRLEAMSEASEEERLDLGSGYRTMEIRC
jgi:hypothetical protein